VVVAVGALADLPPQLATDAAAMTVTSAREIGLAISSGIF
jgi:hypothetical protein